MDPTLFSWGTWHAAFWVRKAFEVTSAAGLVRIFSEYFLAKMSESEYYFLVVS